MYKNTIGATIKFNVLQDLTGQYTEVGFTVHKPNSTDDITWKGSVSDKSRIVYTLKSGDVDTVGKYTLQAYVKNGDSICYSEIKTFLVEETL